MSIWSTFADLEHLLDGQYANDEIEDSWIDLADTGLRGGRGHQMRLCVDDGESEARVALTRRQVVQLRDHLTDWLDRTTREA